ncbi:hypothetical protein NEHOM01_1167 [Nematocida homosporus]|uniref:uncharacterized protein n=1 Tax=Nematocida homosporus TaxID=1912981 RepID=UPI00221E80BA|nr:uncharacterized protein NEHOM01_1167 [Nematocida homosporus]KAI5185944.1 hypothetical protein NEHOM01_1167 [Nematocida homosporus]
MLAKFPLYLIATALGFEVIQARIMDYRAEGSLYREIADPARARYYSKPPGYYQGSTLGRTSSNVLKKRAGPLESYLPASHYYPPALGYVVHSETSRLLTPRTKNFMYNNINIVYLYNRGLSRFIGYNHENNINYKAVDVDGGYAKFTLVIVPGDEGSAVERLLEIPDGDYKASLATKKLSVREGMMKWYAEEGLKKGSSIIRRADGGTNSELIITPTYYQRDHAFKIMFGRYCATAKYDTGDITLEECVDDNDGHPTIENDLQLFTWCSVKSPRECIKNSWGEPKQLSHMEYVARR